MQEYARLKCEEQRVLVGNELVSYSEDLSIQNQENIHDLCRNAEEPKFD
jgi:hypothetical protein